MKQNTFFKISGNQNLLLFSDQIIFQEDVLLIKNNNLKINLS